jgi:hypothetical protein
MAWLLPYFGQMIPFYQEHIFPFSISGDIMFIFSFFVLGGEFWDKLQALFIYNAKTVLPPKTGQDILKSAPADAT